LYGCIVVLKRTSTLLLFVDQKEVHSRLHQSPYIHREHCVYTGRYAILHTQREYAS